MLWSDTRVQFPVSAVFYPPTSIFPTQTKKESTQWSRTHYASVSERASSVKYSRYKGRDVIPLWIADMDFPSPNCVIQALQQHVAGGDFGYSSYSSDRASSCGQAVSSYIKRKQGWEVSPHDVTWLPNAHIGLMLAAGLAAPDQAVLTFTPIYPPFLSVAAMAGRRLATCPLVWDQHNPRWTFDLDALERTVVEQRVGVLLLCNPHNPTGRVFTRQELQGVAEVCVRHDVLICADELWSDLIEEPSRTPHVCIATLRAHGQELQKRTILLDAPSKTFNLPGLKCAYLATAHEPLRKRVRHAAHGFLSAVNTLGLVALEAAYQHGEPWRVALLAYLAANKALLHTAFEQGRLPGLALCRSEATYLAWIDARALGLADSVAFFEESGVGLSDGRDFGAPGRGHVRLNFATPRSLLEEALRRMQVALAKR
eukprot:g50409.t1